MLTRSDAWWKHRIFADPESWREGKSALRHVVFEEDGAATGYVAYRQKGNWDDFIASGEIDLAELVTTSDAAHTGMWSFLTNVDLFTKLSFWNLPVDDPLPWKITEPRRLRRRLVDALWVRIMDVPAALEARAYEWDSALTFEVTDPAGTDVSGTYRLETSGGAATCRPVSDSADVSLGSDVLGHLYLGGGDALAMSAAGRIQGDPAAISALHRMFHTDRAPWCPEVF
jgi:predicted acetyltransferase